MAHLLMWSGGCPVSISGRQSIQIIARDITERKNMNANRKPSSQLVRPCVRQLPGAEILNVILDQLVELFKADGVMLVLPNPQTGGFH
ncbi:MAG: hypothetical protein IPL71_20715 [Anaerolineales bacterium]|uniref:hypothetical protein n=1 Tax=Candidatus Villigracilis proximus TaxID=3140683 RepID=UPI0031374B1A|nr:hypothetical protein [Anaerolineales bacterium]